MELDETVVPVKGLLVYYINTGMMPKLKAEKYIKDQAFILKGLADRLSQQGIESVYFAINNQTDSGENRVEYINLENTTTTPIQVVDSLKMLALEYIQLNERFESLSSIKEESPV